MNCRHRFRARGPGLLSALALLSSANLAPGQVTFLNSFGGLGTGNNQFSLPRGVAVGSNGTVYVADTNNERIQIFSSSGIYQSTLGTTGTIGTSNNQFFSPGRVTIGSAGTVYVADTENQRVQIFNSSGAYQSTVSTTGTSGFNFPAGMAVGSDGRLYVADIGNQRVQIFNASGGYQSTLGSLGSGNNQFFLPEGVALDASGKIYVADSGNHRVQIFNSAGGYQSTLGANINSPYDVAVGSNGTVYVDDFANHCVQIFNASGGYQGTIGTAGISGTGNNQFNAPQAIAVGSNGIVYVADSSNNRIVRYFDPGSWAKGTNNFTDPSVGPTSFALNTFLTLNPTMGFNLGSSLTVTGTNGELYLNGGSLSAGSLTVSDAGVYSFVAGSHAVTSTTILDGTLTGQPYTIGSNESMLLGGGTISSAALDVSGAFNYSDGSLNSPRIAVNSGGLFFSYGGFTVSNGQNLSLVGGMVTSSGTLTNSGVISGSGNISGFKLNNLAGGVIRVGGSDSLQISNIATNSGSIQLISGGSINFSSGLANNAQIQISGNNAANFFGALTNTSGSKVSVAGNSVATFWNNVTNAVGSQFQVSAGSTVVFFGNVTGLSEITGSGTTDFEGGTAAAPLVANGTAIVGSSFTATSIRDNTLVVNAPATITAKATANDPTGTTVLNALSIASGGRFDLTNNSLIIDYTGLAGTLLADTRSELLNHFLTSSSADAMHGLGYADNAVLGKTSFAGQTVDSSSLLMKYTYYGDANLDGKVNALDFNALATNFGKTPGSDVWTQGDFNYDGSVSTSDFTAMAGNFNATPLSEPPVLGTLVPEPATIASLVALGALLRRRRT